MNQINLLKVPASGLAMLLLVLGCASVFAGGPPDDSKIPLQEMKKLNPLLGTWSVKREMTTDGGKTWEPYAKATVQVKAAHRGLLIEELAQDPEDSLFNVGTYLTYDQYQQVFRQAAVEDYWGVMDISEGKIVGDALVLTNTESETYYPMEKGQLRALKVSIEIASPNRTVNIDESYDGGKNWAPTFRLHYALKKTETDSATDKITVLKDRL